MQVGFHKGITGALSGRWFGGGSTRVSKNSRIDTTRKSSSAKVGLGADPVVINCLIRLKLEYK